MALPFPVDPSLPSNPSPLFSDVTAARGDHLRANNAEIWADLTFIADVMLGYATTPTAGGTTVLTAASPRKQYFTGSDVQTIQLPVVSTLSLGDSIRIINNGTKLLTVQSSGGNVICTVAPGEFKILTCVLVTGATAASWSFSPNPAYDLIIGEDIRELLGYHEISSSFPWWCLNQPDTTITAAAVPDLASAMRSYKVRMKPWSDNISTWDCTAWSTSGSAGTLTFAKNANLSGTVTAADSATLTFSSSQSLSVGDILILSTGAIVRVISGATTSWVVDIAVTITAGTARIATYEELMIRALYYAQEKHGSYTDWFCLSLTSAIGNIPAGDYLISGLSVSSNTITIITTATAGSGSGTFSDLVEIYPFRIPSSADARHYSWAGHNLVNAGGDEHTLVAGLMRLDYMQRLTGESSAGDTQGLLFSDVILTDAGVFYRGAQKSTRLSGTSGISYKLGFDSANSLNARAGKRTHGADAGIYTYIYAGTVAA